MGAANAQTGQTGSQEHLSELSLEQLMSVQVETAALKKQSLSDAPADVTVITAAEIRRYGYRTLAEVLAHVRGFYTTQDGGFEYPGVRGFALLGDYNTRFLVMINSHQMTDNVYGAMYMFGQDFGLDLDLVEQIEVVRGPSSSLYGSNGIFATINIITKTAGDQASGRVSTEIGSYGETKLLGSATFRVGRTGRGLISGSGFHTEGRTVGMSTPDNPGQVQNILDVGREQGFHTFATVSWNRWSVAAMFGERRVAVPTGYFGADLGDLGTRSLDARNFAEVAWRRPLGKSSALKWRAYYDQYRYDGIYNYVKSDSSQNYDGAAGDWVGSQLLYQRDETKLGSITAGTEANIDIRNWQYDYNLNFTPEGTQRVDVFSIRHPNANYALFIQDEWHPATAWTIYIGGRFDDTRNDKALFSPRAAVIYKRSDSTYKLMYGRAFRNPSTFERYWTPNPGLEAERIQSIELSREQQFHKNLRLLTSAFYYRLSGLIQGVPVTDTTLEYQNSSKASAAGLEFELSGHPFEWLDTTASYTVHRVRGVNDDTRLENSPAHLIHLRAAVPLAQNRVVVGGAMRYISSRITAFDEVTPAATLFDLTANAKGPSRMELQFGIRNLFNEHYADPLSTEHLPAVLPRAGRTAYVKLTWHGD
jgi:iron complex outermembrane receptor protein